MREKQLNPEKMQMRKGIAMIELIFAIVIIGITLMSIPNLIHQASESGYTTIQQESIAAAASDLSLILSREWDESGTDPSIGSPILDTDSSSTSLDTRPRPGGLSRSFTTGLGGTSLTASPSSAFNTDGDFDDLDDAHDVTGTVTLMDGNQDLIDINISIATNIVYIKDTPKGTTDDWDSSATIIFEAPFTQAAPGSTTNIKSVSITLTSSNTAEELADKKIIFRAYSCNIGSYKLERRE